MAEFSKDVAGLIRKTGMTTGAGVGFGAASTVYGGLGAAGLLAAVPAAGTIFVTFPLVAGYLGWKAAKKVADIIDDS
jgi:hypothetical protein